MIFELMRTCFYGVMEVIVIGTVGALIINRMRSSSDTMEVLSSLFIRITLPCLVFTNMSANFSTGGIPLWWLFPLLGLGLFLAGGLLAYGYSKLDRSVKNMGVFTASVTFNNSLLLPLAFAPVLFSSERLPTFLNLLFLYNIFTVPAFFTLGVWMVHSSSGRKFRFRTIFTPPNIATVLGLVCAVTGWHSYIPRWMITQLRTFGSLSAPLSTLIVGGVIISSLSKITLGDWVIPVKITLLKSLVLPVLATLFVFLTRPPEYIALFIIMGSVMPVGSIVAVIIPPDEGLQKMVAGGILLTNLASIPAVPVFMSLYGMLYGWI